MDFAPRWLASTNFQGVRECLSRLVGADEDVQVPAQRLGGNERNGTHGSAC